MTRHNVAAGIVGAAALELAFSGITTTSGAGSGRRAGLRLALPSTRLRGPGKYKVLEHRRRQAQMKARHLLDLMEEAR
jgi:hypothetical protein